MENRNTEDLVTVMWASEIRVTQLFGVECVNMPVTANNL